MKSGENNTVMTKSALLIYFPFFRSAITEGKLFYWSFRTCINISSWKDVSHVTNAYLFTSVSSWKKYHPLLSISSSCHPIQCIYEVLLPHPSPRNWNKYHTSCIIQYQKATEVPVLSPYSILQWNITWKKKKGNCICSKNKNKHAQICKM